MTTWSRGGALALALFTTASARAQPAPGEVEAPPGPPVAGAVEPASATPDTVGAPWSLDLTIHDVGLGIGDTRHVDGLKLNYRDRGPSVVHGVAVTIWSPHQGVRTEVTGLLLGLPLAGAERLRGIGLGAGVGVGEQFDGLGLGLIGVGAGAEMNGHFLGGLGAGAGGHVSGLLLGGLGAGAGGGVDGFLVGGLGAGSGGRVRGLALAGLGAGAGAGFDGLMLAGLGAGAGGSSRGLMVAGLGGGVGGDFDGILIGGLGAGVGGTLRGLVVAGLGAGASRLRGVAAAFAVGGRDVAGVVVAPGLFTVVPEGRFAGLSVSAFNRIAGAQHGLAIGLVNYAHELHGVQLGLVNIAGNNHGLARVLPVANVHLD